MGEREASGGALDNDNRNAQHSRHKAEGSIRETHQHPWKGRSGGSVSQETRRLAAKHDSRAPAHKSRCDAAVDAAGDDDDGDRQLR